MPSLDSQVELMGLFGDATRVRLLCVLADHELSVAELTSVTELGQSRVSTHLGKLREAGLLLDRRAGTSTFYRLNENGMAQPARLLWAALRKELDDAEVRQDQKRAQRVVAARSGASWPERLAGEMERHYSPGRTWDSLARAFLSLVRAGDVLDVGAGDGTVAELMAPRARSITCLDISPRVLDAAQQRLTGRSHVRFVRGDMLKLPFSDDRFDQVLLLNTLAYAPRPAQALDEAARVVRPGGSLLVVTLAKHDHLDVASQYGHRHAGFEPRWLRRRLSALEIQTCSVTSRERRRPHFRVVTCLAQKPVCH